VCIRYRGNVFTEPLPSNDKGDFYRTEPLPSNNRGIHIQTHRVTGGILKAVEMGPGAVICVTSFIKIGSGVQKLIGGIHRQTDRHTHTHTHTWTAT
jgi:hypothetical protein